MALPVVDTSLGEAHSLEDVVCFMSLLVGPVGWLSVPEGSPVSGGCWLSLAFHIRVFTPLGLIQCSQVYVLVHLDVTTHECLGLAEQD